MTTDVILNDNKGYYDFDWAVSGDIDTGATLDTYVLMCLFEEKRASESEVPQSNLRRGWLGNEHTPGFEQGGKTWLFTQERMTGTSLAELGPVIRNALQPLIDDGLAKSVDVETPTIRNGRVVCYITFGRDGSLVDRRYYELWDNTGGF